MQRILSLSRILVIVGFFISFFVNSTPVSAVGVTPAYIEVNSIANGLRIPKQIIVTRSPNSTELGFKVTVSGEAARYIELPTDSFTMKAGQTTYGFPFFISPKNAPNGTYEVKLIFISQAPKVDNKKGGGNSVAIQVGAQGIVIFSVTDKQIKSFEILSVSLDDTEEGSPLFVRFQLRNTGNVDAKPDKMVVELYDETDPAGNVDRFEVGGSGIEFVSPLETKEIIVPVNINVPKGRYKARIVFFADNQEKYGIDSLILNVYPENTLQQLAEVVFHDIGVTTFEPNDIIKFSADIKNTGEVTIKPVYFVEIKRDGKIIDILRSEEKIVFKGKSTGYSIIYRPEKEGNYTAEAFFEYGIQQTEKKQFQFVVQRVFHAKSLMGNVGIGLAILAAVLIALYVVKRHRGNKK